MSPSNENNILMAAKTHDTHVILSIKVLFTLKLFSSVLERNMKYKRHVESFKTPLCEAKSNETYLPCHLYSFAVPLFEFTGSSDHVEGHVLRKF